MSIHSEPPVEPGSEVKAEIDTLGKAHYDHPVSGTPWYSRFGDYEVVT